jgi:hypothetical protein
MAIKQRNEDGRVKSYRIALYDNIFKVSPFSMCRVFAVQGYFLFGPCIGRPVSSPGVEFIFLHYN